MDRAAVLCLNIRMPGRTLAKGADKLAHIAPDRRRRAVLAPVFGRVDDPVTGQRVARVDAPKAGLGRIRQRQRACGRKNRDCLVHAVYDSLTRLYFSPISAGQ